MPKHEPDDLEHTVKVHDTLNPKLWDKNQKLKADVRDKLLDIAMAFMDSLDIDQEPEDIIFTGSSANYNYTAYSDIDLHVILDYEKIDDDVELVHSYMLAKKSIWNDKHEITIKGIPVELYAQDKNEKLVATGIYSVLDDEWIVKPEKENPVIDQKLIDKKTKHLMYEIDDLIIEEDLDKMEKFSEKLKDMRKSGLEKGGEFSTENLVFKALRNEGYLEKFFNAKRKILDTQLSLNGKT